MADVLTDTLTVTVDEDSFVFRIPTPMDQLQMGVRGASLRRKFDPMGGGWEVGLDDSTYSLVRGMVALETLLKQSSATWPYSEKMVDGRPSVTVDIDSFPAYATPIIIQVYQGFLEALGKFFAGRAGNREHTGPQTVES